MKKADRVRLEEIEHAIDYIETKYADYRSTPADMKAAHRRLCQERVRIIRPYQRAAQRARMKAEAKAARPVEAAVKVFLETTR